MAQIIPSSPPNQHFPLDTIFSTVLSEFSDEVNSLLCGNQTSLREETMMGKRRHKKGGKKSKK
jgi:hypothetical protein